MLCNRDKSFFFLLIFFCMSPNMTNFSLSIYLLLIHALSWSILSSRGRLLPPEYMKNPNLCLCEVRAELEYICTGIFILAATHYGSLDLVTLNSFYWNMLCIITINTALKCF